MGGTGASAVGNLKSFPVLELGLWKNVRPTLFCSCDHERGIDCVGWIGRNQAERADPPRISGRTHAVDLAALSLVGAVRLSDVLLAA